MRVPLEGSNITPATWSFPAPVNWIVLLAPTPVIFPLTVTVPVPIVINCVPEDVPDVKSKLEVVNVPAPTANEFDPPFIGIVTPLHVRLPLMVSELVADVV
jgi:hypothetical protein